MKKYILALMILFALLASCEKNIPGNNFGDTTETVSDTSFSTTESPSDAHGDPAVSSGIPETEAVPPETASNGTEASSALETNAPKELPVKINELCASNKDCFTDENGKSPDWIELYNSSDTTVNLAGYGLSSDPEQPFKYTFSNYLIKAKSYLLLRATGNVGYENGVISLPFKLSKSGETVILTSPEGLSDALTYVNLGEDEAFGRIRDGESTATYLTPTPLSSNNTTEYTLHAPAPSFSHSSGFYSEPFELVLTVPEDCKVFYTTDGSVPSRDSIEYTGPILLKDATNNPNVFSAIGNNSPNLFVTKNNQDKINIIRAVTVDKDGNTSRCINGTFLVMSGDRAAAYDNMAVLSVYTNSENLFDYDTGIYMLGREYDNYMNGPDFDPELPTWSRPANYMLSGDESERSAAIEYFDEEHKLQMAQNVGIRIGGNASRANRQKTFKFYARSEYGDSNFDYPLFGDDRKFDSFIMRSGANDFSKSKIRDVLAQSLVSHRDFTTSKWRPCAMFLNGEYWGLYMIMERYDSDFYQEKYGVDKDEIVSVKVGRIDIGSSEDKKLYDELKKFCRNNDLTKPENYEKLCDMIDIESYIEYVCLNTIISNNDWPGNNTALWRTRSVDASNPYADGKWRWVCYDTERSMSLYGETSGEGYVGNVYPKLINNGLIFKHVYKNEAFQRQFVTTLIDMLKNDFTIDKIETYLAYFEETLSEQMKLNRKRYNTTGNYSREIGIIRDFWQKREPYVIDAARELFGSVVDEALTSIGTAPATEAVQSSDLP